MVPALQPPDPLARVASVVRGGDRPQGVTGLDEAAARAEITAAEAETGLPADDPVRFGAGALLEAVA